MRWVSKSDLECMDKLRLEDLEAHPPAPSPSPGPEPGLNNGTYDDAALHAEAIKALDAAVWNTKPSGNALAGTRIGAYRIERELGRGGMGSVVLASRVDNEFQRKVAIKLLHQTDHSEHLLQRFRNERQILANLDHPNIARLLDGGATANGEPYFVMEYVRDAQNITDYCEHRELPLKRRLELFLDACAAVQYAHRFLIVHRDLKPSNILVSADETVKLMDFGIAKNLLAERLSMGQAAVTIGAQPMTPAYASPEQVRGEPISTSSDVYSLGIVLYELLAGRHPFLRSDQPLPDLLRSICDTDPLPPSASTAQAPLDGRSTERTRHRPKDDLDRIVLMAIRKDAARRYVSVEQMAEDIRRYLNGQPVIAHDDLLAYRWKKFLLRNRMGVGAVAIVILSLIGGIISTRAEQVLTQRRLNEVRELANSLVFEINDGIKNLPGSTPIRATIVKRALTYLDRLSRESSNDRELLQDLAQAYRRIGDIQYRVGSANLGDAAGAMESARKELGIRESLARSGAQDRASRLAMAEVSERFGELLQTTGQTAAAPPYFARALEMREHLIREFPEDESARLALAVSYRTQGDLARERGKGQDAHSSYLKALAIHKELADKRPGDKVNQKQLSMDYVRVGDILGSPNQQNLDRPEEGLANYYIALAIRQHLSQSAPGNPIYQRDVANVYQRMGSLLRSLKRSSEALDHTRLGLAIYEKLSADDPVNLEVRRDIAVSYAQMASILEKSGEGMRDAIAASRKAAAIYESIRERDSKNARSVDDLAGTYSNLASMLLQTEDLEGAAEYYQRSNALSQGTAASPRNRIRDARNWSGLATIYARRGQSAKARQQNENALRLLLEMQEKGLLRANDVKLLDRVRQDLAVAARPGETGGPKTKALSR